MSLLLVMLVFSASKFVLETDKERGKRSCADQTVSPSLPRPLHVDEDAMVAYVELGRPHLRPLMVSLAVLLVCT